MRIERVQAGWIAHTSMGPVPVEEAKVFAHRVGRNFVEGELVLSHGVPFELTSKMTKAQLAEIGITGPYGMRLRAPRGSRAVRLTREGQILEGLM